MADDDSGVPAWKLRALEAQRRRLADAPATLAVTGNVTAASKFGVQLKASGARRHTQDGGEVSDPNHIDWSSLGLDDPTPPASPTSLRTAPAIALPHARGGGGESEETSGDRGTAPPSRDSSPARAYTAPTESEMSTLLHSIVSSPPAPSPPATTSETEGASNGAELAAGSDSESAAECEAETPAETETVQKKESRRRVKKKERKEGRSKRERRELSGMGGATAMKVSARSSERERDRERARRKKKRHREKESERDQDTSKHAGSNKLVGRDKDAGKTGKGGGGGSRKSKRGLVASASTGHVPGSRKSNSLDASPFTDLDVAPLRPATPSPRSSVRRRLPKTVSAPHIVYLPQVPLLDSMDVLESLSDDTGGSSSDSDADSARHQGSPGSWSLTSPRDHSPSLYQEVRGWFELPSPPTEGVVPAPPGSPPRLRGKVDGPVSTSPPSAATLAAGPARTSISRFKSPRHVYRRSGVLSAQRHQHAPVAQPHVELLHRFFHRLLSQSRIRKVARAFSSTELARRCRSRHHVLNEIIDTEKSYYHHLQLAHDNWVVPLRERARADASAVPTLTQIDHIISTLDDVKALSEQLLLRLTERVRTHYPVIGSVGDVFIEMTPAFTIYTQYVNNHDASRAVYKQCRLDAEFALFDAAARLASENHMLETLLITPVQRLPRYLLLLKELLKLTPPEHCDYSDLRTAISSLAEMTMHINQRKEQQEQLLAVQQRITATSSQWSIVAPDRYLVREGDITYYTEKGKLASGHLYLLNDLLLLTSANEASVITQVFAGRAKKTHHLIASLSLRHLTLDESALSLHEFRLVFGAHDERQWRFLCESTEEAISWTDSLRDTTVLYLRQLDYDDEEGSEELTKDYVRTLKQQVQTLRTENSKLLDIHSRGLQRKEELVATVAQLERQLITLSTALGSEQLRADAAEKRLRDLEGVSTPKKK